MWTYIKDSISDGFEDLGYNAKRMGALFFGKAGAHELPQLLPQVLGGISGAAAGVLGHLASLIVIPSIAAVSAGVVQYDHIHRRRRIMTEYTEEIAKIVGKKDPKSVTEADMDRLAKGDLKAGIRANLVLKEALDQSRVERNTSIVASTIASVGAYGVVQWFEHAVGTEHAIAKVLEATSIEGALLSLGTVLVNATVGLLAYFAVKTPLHAYGGKALGLEKETTQDRIHDIRWALNHGRSITPEMVLEVHLHARPELNEQVKDAYGKLFEKLPASVRAQVVEQMDKEFHLSEIAIAIATGTKKPEELAFEVQGQHSGVHPKPKKGVAASAGASVWERLAALRERGMEIIGAPVAEVANFLPGETKVAIYAPDANTAAVQVAHQYETSDMKKNFVAAVGRKISDNGMTHVERYHSSGKWVIERE